MTNDPPRKRRRNIVPPLSRYQEAADIISEDVAQTMLQRAIAQVLKDNGFQSADPVAMEEMRRLADRRMRTLTANLCSIMATHRRSRPTVSDFELLLADQALSPTDLYYTAKPPTHHITVQPHLAPPLQPSAMEQPPPDLTALLGNDLTDTAHDSSAKLYSHLPDFPSAHTWRSTAVFAERPTEPRAIREIATKEARLAEEALRKLLVAGKRDVIAPRGQEKGDGPKKMKIDILWEAAMREVGGQSGNRQGEGMVEVVVNSEMRFWRKGGKKRKR